MPIKGSYLAIAGAGGVLLWSGLRGKQWSDVVRQTIAGKQPTATTTAYPLITNVSSSPSGSSNISGGGGSSRRGTLNAAQIGALWIANGGNPAKVRVAVCIAQHESGGRTGVTSSNPDGGINVGLYQLDTRGKGAGFTVAQLSNPVINTRITVKATRNGVDWSAWATAPMCGV
jgi:Lysozyme like domain